MIVKNLRNLRRSREVKKWFKHVDAYDVAIAIHEDAIEIEDGRGVTCAISVWDGARIIDGLSHDPQGQLEPVKAPS